MAIRAGQVVSYALIGNPNTGKTTLFNRLCGVRAQTANYPGVTVDARVGTLDSFRITDLPGAYGLDLPLPEAEFCANVLRGDTGPAPDAVLLVVDATNLGRTLTLASEVLAFGLPIVIALNMIDVARDRGLEVDADGLGRRLGCPVVPVNARNGEGVEELVKALGSPRASTTPLPPEEASARSQWAHRLAQDYVEGLSENNDRPLPRTDRADAFLTHPFWGLLFFVLVMTGVFVTIFSLAAVPMDLIELTFEKLSALAANVIPEGTIRDLITDGIIGGIAGTVVFLPQICLLFFLISLLEDTGYLARAAFVTDRLMRRFGLPGQAFVPLLSSHACAIPGIMSCRLIPERADRLTTILVAPFMSCSARLPVYVLLISLLFADPLWAGLAFAGCYVLGALAAVFSAFLARRTILPGAPRSLMLELPGYKAPSLRNAVLTTFDRATVFLKNAGTVIMAICVVMWWLSAYPVSEPSTEVAQLEAQGLVDEAEILAGKQQLESSFAGKLGHAIEPVMEPLGYDWQLSVGVVASFAAREVFVSTMAVILGSQSEEEDSVLESIQKAERSDGTPLLTTRVAASLLVFYVLAMQCLPTLAVTRREAGGWKWALLQLAYMTVLAYVAALLTYHGLHWFGVA